MTFDQAKELGEVCGLTEPAEWVNNALRHLAQLLPYSEVPAAEAKLIETARAAGVQFSEVCGDAILAGESPDDYCYICRKLQAATGGQS